MAKKITVAGRKPRKGMKMRAGSKWRLVSTKSKGLSFTATLLATVNRGKVRIAIFSAPKRG